MTNQVNDKLSIGAHTAYTQKPVMRTQGSPIEQIKAAARAQAKAPVARASLSDKVSVSATARGLRQMAATEGAHRPAASSTRLVRMLHQAYVSGDIKPNPAAIARRLVDEAGGR